MRIVVDEGSCGIAAGAQKVRNALLECDLGNASVGITGCIGMCYLEPSLIFMTTKASSQDLLRFSPTTPRILPNTHAQATHQKSKDLSFQTRIVNF